MKKITTYALSLSVIALFISSCTKDTTTSKTTMDFSYEYVDSFKYAHCKVTFTITNPKSASYEWDFGDGQSSVEQNPVHVFEEPGTYTVKLTNTKAKSSVEKSVKVYDLPKISTWATYYNDSLLYIGTYTYDNKNRLSKVEWTDNSFETYAYSDTSVVDKYFYDNVLSDSYIYKLNSKGLASSCIETWNSSEKRGTAKKKSARLKEEYNSLFKFTYNSDSYLIKEEINDVEIYLYTIEKGNQVGIDYIYTEDQAYSYTKTCTYCDTINTTGNECVGIYFLGKQDRNIVNTIVTQQGDNTTTSKRKYTLDSKGRVATKIIELPDYTYKYIITYVE
jgi:PKD repeat protein